MARRLFSALSYSGQCAQARAQVSAATAARLSSLLGDRVPSPVPSSLKNRDPATALLHPWSEWYSQLKFCLCPLQAPRGSGLCQQESPRPAPPCHTFPERCPLSQLLRGFLPLAKPTLEVRKPRLPGQRQFPLSYWLCGLGNSLPLSEPSLSHL